MLNRIFKKRRKTEGAFRIAKCAGVVKMPLSVALDSMYLDQVSGEGEMALDLASLRRDLLMNGDRDVELPCLNTGYVSIWYSSLPYLCGEHAQ